MIICYNENQVPNLRKVSTLQQKHPLTARICWEAFAKEQGDEPLLVFYLMMKMKYPSIT